MLGDVEPLFTIRLFEHGLVACWTGDVANVAGKQIASATAPSLWTVWDMLAAVLRQEVVDDGDDGDD